MEQKEKLNLKPIIITVLIWLAVTLFFVAGFSVILSVTDINLKYSPVFSTLSLGFGGFAASYYLSAKKGSNGLLTGLVIGLIIFTVITLVGLIINSAALSFNTVFHLIIIVLSSSIGGILGVNRKPKSYI